MASGQDKLVEQLRKSGSHLNVCAAVLIGDQAKRIASLEAALDIAKEYLDNHSDCVDGDYGVPAPNDAMKCLREIDEAMGERYV
jgi:hypothetical protein